MPFINLHEIDWYTTISTLISELVILMAAYVYVKHNLRTGWRERALNVVRIWPFLIFASMVYLVFMDQAVHFEDNFRPIAVMLSFCVGIYLLAKFTLHVEEKSWYVYSSYAAMPMFFLDPNVAAFVWKDFVPHIVIVVLSIAAFALFCFLLRSMLQTDDPIKTLTSHPWVFASWIALTLIRLTVVDMTFLHMGFIMVLFIEAFWVWIGLMIAWVLQGGIRYMLMDFSS